jgi:hypothetical protein
MSERNSNAQRRRVGERRPAIPDGEVFLEQSREAEPLQEVIDQG